RRLPYGGATSRTRNPALGTRWLLFFSKAELRASWRRQRQRRLLRHASNDFGVRRKLGDESVEGLRGEVLKRELLRRLVAEHADLTADQLQRAVDDSALSAPLRPVGILDQLLQHPGPGDRDLLDRLLDG